MKSTVLVTKGEELSFARLLSGLGIRVSEFIFIGDKVKLSIDGFGVPDVPEVNVRMWRSHTSNTSTLKIEWIPVASDSDDQGEE